MPVAVVTGASRGLGRRTAIALARAGYSVGINYFHSAKEANEVVFSPGISSMAVKADIGNLHDVEKMAQRVHQQWGRIDVLVNNAGIARDGLMMGYFEHDWDEVMRVNLKGCVNTVKSFAPLMIQSGGGHIINISSYSGLRGKAGQAAYSASKASVIGFSYSLARELGRYNIKVNCILPGYMPTEMGMSAEEAMKTTKEESILHRLSDPEDVVRFITYLVTTETITGQVFCLDSRI
jgi:3-oxoacyl-[acyl-carrier protein] reductase